mgnify:FL=1|tara:strand:+ start:186 stop:437 length:252 start_codon:yes stop_codon:yes gene_type:complete
MEKSFRIVRTVTTKQNTYSIHEVSITQKGNQIHQEVDPVPVQLTFDSLEQLNYNLIKYLDACTHPVIDNMQDDLEKAKDIFKK